MMAAWGLHLDFAPDVAGGALFPYLECMVNQTFGMVIGKGGADTIVKAMVGALKAKGGELILGAPVARIEISSGRATGVTLADGRAARSRARRDRQRASEARIRQTASPRTRPGRTSTRASSAFRAGPGHDDDPSWRSTACRTGAPARELQRFAYVHVAPDLEMMARVYAEASAGLLPAEPALVVGQPTAIDPSRAPAGKHVLWVQVRVLPAEIRGDAEGRDRGDELGRGARRPMPSACWTSWSATRRGFARRILGPRGLLAARSRARKSQPDRRRQSFRQPSSRPEFFPPARRRAFALPHAGEGPLSLRRLDLARRGNRRGLGFHAREDARGMRRRLVIASTRHLQGHIAKAAAVLTAWKTHSKRYSSAESYEWNLLLNKLHRCFDVSVR